jgi:CheY-like chemotaxis protein
MVGTVLVIEDNAGFRRVAVKRLSGMDLQVLEASNAQEARKFLGKRIIDLAILDIGLGKVAAFRGEPGGDSGSSGFELLERIRSRESLKNGKPSTDSISISVCNSVASSAVTTPVFCRPSITSSTDKYCRFQTPFCPSVPNAKTLMQSTSVRKEPL